MGKDTVDDGAVLLITLLIFGVVALGVWGANVSNSSCVIRSEGPASASINGRLFMQGGDLNDDYQNLSVNFPATSVSFPGMTLETRGETCTQALSELMRLETRAQRR